MIWSKGILWKLFIDQLHSVPYIIFIDSEQYVICEASVSSLIQQLIKKLSKKMLFQISHKYFSFEEIWYFFSS